MPPEISSSPCGPSSSSPPTATTSTLATPSKKRGAAVAPVWTASEDEVILRLRRSQQPPAWSAVAAAVNELPGSERTTLMVSHRWHNTLKHVEAVSGDPLNAREKECLRRAVGDLDAGIERWWFVAARYNELRKKAANNGDARELGKTSARKFWEIIQKDDEAEGRGDRDPAPKKARKRKAAQTAREEEKAKEGDEEEEGEGRVSDGEEE